MTHTASGLDLAQLRPPFVLTEPDDFELHFFVKLDDILSDAFDVLWNEHYTGYDSAGKKFYLQRFAKEQRWYEKLLNTQEEYLEVTKIDSEPMPDEIVSRLRDWDSGLLTRPEIAKQMPDVTVERIQTASLPELIKIGIRMDNVTCDARWRQKVDSD